MPAPAPTSPTSRPPAGLFLGQPERGYRYSLDPFLLAGFCRPRRRERILDLGAGVGVIGLLLASSHPTVSVVALELDPELARHAAGNARLNGLAERCHVLRADLRDATRLLPPEHFHRVVANPPFRPLGSGRVSAEPGRAGARHEATYALGDLAATAVALLRCGGSLDLIHLAERLAEVLCTLARSGLEPKVLRLVSPFPEASPRLFLVTATKGARSGIRVLPNLVVHSAGNRYSDEVRELLQAGRPGSRPGPKNP